jgi:hypothetical protein
MPKRFTLPLTHTTTGGAPSYPLDAEALVRQYGVEGRGEGKEVIIIRKEWVEACVEKRRVLGSRRDYGGWRVTSASFSITLPLPR